MKNKGLLITLIVILSFIAILLSSFMYLLLNNKIKFGTMNTELISDDIYEKEYEKINIDMNAGDVYLNGTNEKFIRVVVYASNNDEIITKEKQKIIEINNNINESNNDNNTNKKFLKSKTIMINNNNVKSSKVINKRMKNYI